MKKDISNKVRTSRVLRSIRDAGNQTALAIATRGILATRLTVRQSPRFVKLNEVSTGTCKDRA